MNNENTTVLKKNTNKDDIGLFLEKYKSTIIKALPKHITADKILRVALTEIRRNPRLSECNKVSLISAIVQSAQLGLLPDSLTGHAYLIPYGGECQFQIGYKGMMRLVYNSGQVLNITAEAVYNDDFFEFEYGLKPALKHIPSYIGSRDEKDLKCVYAIAYLKNGGTAYVVLPKKDIEWHRSFSMSVKNPKTARFSPWVTAYIEMAKKTAIRALCKYLPMSSDDNSLQTAIALDEAAERGEQKNEDIFDGEILEIESPKEETSLAEELANG